MHPPTSAARALCLLLVVVVVTIVGAASAAGGVDKNSKKTTTLPGSCLMAASTLCADADTNAMRCLRKLAFLGDVRVPNACADAIMAGVTINPRLKQASRTQQLARMLTEGGACAAGNSCAGTLGGQNDQLCNAVINGCAGCSKGTYTVTSDNGVKGLTYGPNSAGYNCNNICCNGFNGGPACCLSFIAAGQIYVGCTDAGHTNCPTA